jgi:hypothetical protein
VSHAQVPSEKSEEGKVNGLRLRLFKDLYAKDLCISSSLALHRSYVVTMATCLGFVSLLVVLAFLWVFGVRNGLSISTSW